MEGGKAKERDGTERETGEQGKGREAWPLHHKILDPPLSIAERSSNHSKISIRSAVSVQRSLTQPRDRQTDRRRH